MDATEQCMGRFYLPVCLPAEETNDSFILRQDRNPFSLQVGSSAGRPPRTASSVSAQRGWDTKGVNTGTRCSYWPPPAEVAAGKECGCRRILGRRR